VMVELLVVEEKRKRAREAGEAFYVNRGER